MNAASYKLDYYKSFEERILKTSSGCSGGCSRKIWRSQGYQIDKKKILIKMNILPKNQQNFKVNNF